MSVGADSISAPEIGINGRKWIPPLQKMQISVGAGLAPPKINIKTSKSHISVINLLKMLDKIKKIV